MTVTQNDEPADGTPSYVRTPAAPYLSSLAVDRRLAKYDVAGSIAHAEMLASVGLLTAEESDAIARGLRRIASDIGSGIFPWREELEDVHTNVEVQLTKDLGALGAKLHTGRSRNDQVALDARLWARDAIVSVQERLVAIQTALLGRAEAHLETLMPGYTHLQRAQPVTLGHHLAAHFWRLSRDFERLTDAFRRANVSPLGAGALAGTTLPIDPSHVSQTLGFTAPFENSLDAVSDRDFLADLLSALSLLAVHLSALGEELVLWSTPEFGFLRPTAALGGGSSIMPQKRNPDVAELARGKAGRVVGDLVSLLTTLKSLPLAYNRDLQEDKGAAFDAADHVIATLDALGTAIPDLEFDAARMGAAARDAPILATDLAEYLVTHGVPFREAHETVAAFLRKGTAIDAANLRAHSPLFRDDVAGWLDPEAALARRRSHGGPAPDAVREQIARAELVLGRERYDLSKHAERVLTVDRILKEEPA